MIYFDASALVTMVTRRTPWASLDTFLDEHDEPGATSTIGLIETVQQCDTYGTFPHLMRSLVREYDELEVTSEVRDRAAMLPGLKTLDAIHVASAELLGGELSALVTYDKRMAEIARTRGLPVASPGMTM